MIKILIADDHEVFIHGLIEKRLKPLSLDLEIFEAHNYRQAVAIAHETTIDLLICDIEFDNDPERNGQFILSFFRDRFPKMKSIAYTSYNSYQILQSAKKAGFNCFLSKGCSFQEFEIAVNQVLLKGTYVSPTEKELRKNKQLIFDSKYMQGLKAIELLSKGELQLLLYASQTINKYELAEILTRLGRPVKETTVNNHIKTIVKKLHLRNRDELHVFCIEFKGKIRKCFDSKI